MPHSSLKAADGAAVPPLILASCHNVNGVGPQYPHEAATSRTANRRFVLRRIEHLRIVVPRTLGSRVSDRASAV